MPGLDHALLRTVAYADIFDQPLTEKDLARYLDGAAATPAEIRGALARLIPERLTVQGERYALAEREPSEGWRQRERTAAALWPVAVHYGKLLARLPFVRMVAVTGSVARDNAEPGADLDYLLVAANGRVWVVRALAGLLRRWAAAHGTRICPNFVLSEGALAMADRDLYTAHELTQMVPLAGPDVYRRLRAANRWTARYLPNADGPPRVVEPDAPGPRRLTRAAEAVLRTRLGTWLDELERQRIRRKMRADAALSGETVYSVECCKDHRHGHRQRIMRAYAERVARLELAP